MSWGTCYSGTNNIHFDFPPIMSDGRNYASWQPGSVLSNEIKKSVNINKNWQYRKYMVDHADNIIKHNQIQAYNQCSVYENNTNNEPNYGYNNSDLKNLYLSRENLQDRMITPLLNQNELLTKGYKNHN